jgi:hypothetical protein
MNPAVKKRYISYIFFVIKSMEVINSESTQQVSTSLKRNFDGADEEEFSQSILKKPKKGRNLLFKFHKISQNKYLMEIQIQIDCYSLGSSYYHNYDEIKQNQV